MWSKSKPSIDTLPQRGEKSRAAASVVIGARGRVAFFAALVLLALCVALFPPLRRVFTGTVMLFTQRSVHTLAGALRAQGVWAAPYGIFLALFSAALLPWLPPLLRLANAMVFGSGGGYLLSLAGGVLGGCGCFCLSRVLLRGAVRRVEPPLVGDRFRRWGGAWCCAALLLFPGAGGFVGYLFGLSGVSFRRYFAGTAAGEAAVLLAVFLRCSPYQTQLPDAVRATLALAGVLLVALCLLLSRSKAKEMR